MVENATYGSYGSLKDIGLQIRALISTASFIQTKSQLTKVDTVILKMQNLLTSSTGYFGAEARLYVSENYITLAQIVKIINERGEKLSRSGCENRILLDIQKFVRDFGADTAYLLTHPEKIESDTWLAITELKIISIQTGYDYTDNKLDKTLQQHGIDLVSPDGFSTPNKDITTEELQHFLSIIEPYTTEGMKQRKKELQNLSHILWAFRKGMADGSNSSVVTAILKQLQ